MTPPTTTYERGHPREIRGATRIFVDTGADAGHYETIVSTITGALPALVVVPLFAADLAIFYRGAPLSPSHGGAVPESPTDAPVGYGHVSQPDAGWRVARVLLSVHGTAAAFAEAFVAAYGPPSVPKPTDRQPLVC